MIVCLLVGCSEDDAVALEQEQEFLSAQIDGKDIRIDRIEGIISCKKQLNDYGGIDLLIKAEAMNGETLEIFFAGYFGPKNYILGHNTPNNAWMRYGLANPSQNWFSFEESKHMQENNAFLQIHKDDRSYIKGTFGFKAFNGIDNSIKLVSKGSFNFKLVIIPQELGQ